MTAHAGLWGPDNLDNKSGRPIRNRPYAVYINGTNTLAELWLDRDRIDEAPNPGNTGDGNVHFFADPGYYEIECLGQRLDVVVGVDPEDVGSGSGSGTSAGFPVVAAVDAQYLAGTTGLVGWQTPLDRNPASPAAASFALADGDLVYNMADAVVYLARAGAWDVADPQPAADQVCYFTNQDPKNAFGIWSFVVWWHRQSPDDYFYPEFAMDWARATQEFLGADVSIRATGPVTVDGGSTSQLSNQPIIAIAAATTTTAGSMSAADKAKLDGVGGDPAYEHDQAVAATTWTISHPLAYNPGVTLVDSAGTEFEADIAYAPSTITVHLAVASAGKAYLS